MSTDQGELITPPRTLAEIDAIIRSRSEMITRRDQIKEIVEPPLLPACLDLYDKNIRTLSSSANKKDLEVGHAYISIDYETLSPENQKIAQKFGGPIVSDERRMLFIEIPVDKNSTLDSIDSSARQIAVAFQKQPMTWAPTFTVESLKQMYGISSEEHEYDDPKVWEGEGLFFDAENSIFYLSEEHYQKVNEQQ